MTVHLRLGLLLLDLTSGGHSTNLRKLRRREDFSEAAGSALVEAVRDFVAVGIAGSGQVVGLGSELFWKLRECVACFAVGAFGHFL